MTTTKDRLALSALKSATGNTGRLQSVTIPGPQADTADRHVPGTRQGGIRSRRPMPEEAMDTALAHQSPSSGDTHQAALDPFHSPSNDIADASGSLTDGRQMRLLSGGETAASTVTAVDAGWAGLSGTAAGVSAVDVWLGALATQALAVNRMVNHADDVRARNAADRAMADAHAGRTGDWLADQAEKPAHPVDPIRHGTG